MISVYVGGINHDTGDHPGGDNFLSDLIDGRDTHNVTNITGGNVSIKLHLVACVRNIREYF